MQTPCRRVVKGALLAARAVRGAQARRRASTSSAPPRTRVYGSFAVVVGLLVWINLVSRMLLVCAAWTVTAPYDSDVAPSGTADPEPARKAGIPQEFADDDPDDPPTLQEEGAPSPLAAAVQGAHAAAGRARGPRPSAEPRDRRRRRRRRWTRPARARWPAAPGRARVRQAAQFTVAARGRWRWPPCCCTSRRTLPRPGAAPLSAPAGERTVTAHRRRGSRALVARCSAGGDAALRRRRGAAPAAAGGGDPDSGAGGTRRRPAQAPPSGGAPQQRGCGEAQPVEGDAGSRGPRAPSGAVRSAAGAPRAPRPPPRAVGLARSTSSPTGSATRGGREAPVEQLARPRRHTRGSARMSVTTRRRPSRSAAPTKLARAAAGVAVLDAERALVARRAACSGCRSRCAACPGALTLPRLVAA